MIGSIPYNPCKNDSAVGLTVSIEQQSAVRTKISRLIDSI